MKINRSVARAIDMLNMISETKDPLTITEISQRLDIPKSTAFDIINTLVDKGYLETDKKQKTFSMGINVFQVGSRYLDKLDFQSAAHSLLEEMMLKSGETVFLAVENQGRLVYLDKVESNASVRTDSRLGTSNPMYCTGLGKALLAAYENDRVKAIISQEPMKAKTEYTLTNYQELLRDLEQTRRRGYSIDNRESELEVFCVAAPIYDLSGRPVAAISIAGMASRMLGNDQKVAEFGKLVMETALLVSKRLGYRGSRVYEDFN